MATSVAKKLLIKPGTRVSLIGAPEGYPAALGPLPEDVALVAEPRPKLDVVIVFVRDSAALAGQTATLLRAVTDERVTWIAYPKGGRKAGTDLHRDILWQAMGEIGWMGVTLVALDETWSAMRFRPADQVMSARARS
jgi:hypothetical protein